MPFHIFIISYKDNIPMDFYYTVWINVFYLGKHKQNYQNPRPD